MRTLAVVLLALAGSLFSLSSYAQQTAEAGTPPPESTPDSRAQAWLSKLGKAVREQNFSLSFVLLRPGSDAQPYLWRHGVVDGKEFEQISLLNGPGREILRINQRVSYFEPDVPAYTLLSSYINSPLPSQFFAEPLQQHGAYDFIFVGRSRVSGRAAQQIRIVSRDKSRFGLELWLDQDSGLPLKLNRINLKGQVVEQIQATDLQVTAEPDAYFARIQPERLPDVLPLRDNTSNGLNWQLDQLPAGMQVVKKNRHRLALNGQVVDYLMLSDGLVTVSVYVRPLTNGSQDVIARHQSDILLSRPVANYQVTVVGQLPPNTANHIALSVVPRS